MKTLLLLLLCPFLLSATPTVVDAPEALQYAQEMLPHKGPLRRTNEGFVYVKVPNDYILEVLPLLHVGKVETPAYFGQGMVGAHITVISTEEAKGKTLTLPPMRTQIPFKIVNLSSVDLKNDYGSKRVYMFLVDAPELQQIRAANDLPPKVFHITVAFQY